MQDKLTLMIPGPTPVPETVLQAMGRHPIGHRSADFQAIVKRTTEQLQWLHQTSNDVLVITGSGTAAMEAGIINVLSKGDTVLCGDNGKFGERWASICKAYGVPYESIDVAWGEAVSVDEVAKRLDADPSIRAVFGTHSETSTATLHDAKALAQVTRARKRLLVLDAITSLGVHPLPQDAWGVDVVVTGSQKGLMSPPGLATVSLAPWALAEIEGDRLPRFYWDLRKARKNLPAGESAYTPAVSLIYAVGEALTMMKEEGLAEVHARHRRLGAAVRAGGQALGWTLFSKSPADSVTAFEPPAGVDASATIKRLREIHGITVAGGQDHTKGKMLRIGHMGAYDLSDVYVVLAALEECTQAQGRPGSGAVDAARRAWELA